MTEFDALKRTFWPRDNRSDKKFDLPEGTILEKLDLAPAVKDGVLTITR
jgi:hypothetical protein